MSSESNRTPGEWVKQLFDRVFFQPDDGVSAQEMKQYFSPDLKVRINGRLMDRETYENAIIEVRSKCEGVLEKSEELLSNLDEKQSGGGGSFAHKSTFILRDKETGEEKRESTVTIATVAIVDNGPVLCDLTEVTCIHS